MCIRDREVPLSALVLGRLLKGDDPRATRVEVFHEALDGATLARCVAAFEDNDELEALLLDVVLELEQLDLQEPLGRLVLGDLELLVCLLYTSRCV